MLLRVGEMLGGYTIAADLSAGRSYLAEDKGGRRVVLKMLGEDCLLEGELHPSIRLRLARVSQVPSRRVSSQFNTTQRPIERSHRLEKSESPYVVSYNCVHSFHLDAVEAARARQISISDRNRRAIASLAV